MQRSTASHGWKQRTQSQQGQQQLSPVLWGQLWQQALNPRHIVADGVQRLGNHCCAPVPCTGQTTRGRVREHRKRAVSGPCTDAAQPTCTQGKWLGGWLERSAWRRQQLNTRCLDTKHAGCPQPFADRAVSRYVSSGLLNSACPRGLVAASHLLTDQCPLWTAQLPAAGRQPCQPRKKLSCSALA